MFPAPPCSYSTENLFKDLVYIPRYDELGFQKEAIPCLYLPYEQDSKILFFFHGNAEDLGIAYDILKEIRSTLKVSYFHTNCHFRSVYLQWSILVMASM